MLVIFFLFEFLKRGYTPNNNFVKLGTDFYIFTKVSLLFFTLGVLVKYILVHFKVKLELPLVAKASLQLNARKGKCDVANYKIHFTSTRDSSTYNKIH